MTNSAKNNNSKKSVNNIFMVVVLLFSVAVFSQSPVSNSLTDVTVPTATSSQVSSSKSSNVEFVLWFMGTKQNPNSTISTEGNSTRNQILTSGLAPNRLLIKAFLKKAVNFETSLV